MEIIVGKTAGFCYGVKRAVEKTEQELEKNKNIKCLGELVHNETVIKKLTNKGLNIINNIDNVDKFEKLIIRAHGITKEIYETLNKKNIDYFDYTCPSVLQIHNIAEEYSKKGFFIFLIGKKTHPEIIGTISFCGAKSCVIESEEDITDAISKLQNSNIKKLLIIAQTTYNLEKFKSIVQCINSNIDSKIDLEIKNTICNATRIRQEETNELSKKVDCMIIIGGKNSSNTKKLYDIAKTNCQNTILVENEQDLDTKKMKKYNKIGIMAGTSTSKDSIDNIIKTIEIKKKK